MESKIILLTGCAGSGKDTTADIICDITRGVKRGLAEKIRDEICAATMLPREIFTDPLKKNQPLIKLMDDPNSDMIVLPCCMQDESPRTVMQKWGTMMRNTWGKDYFLQMWVMYFNISEALMQCKFNMRVVPDIRFDNEVEFFKKNFKNVLTLKLVRSGYGKLNDHESENEISERYVDGVIENNGNLEDLRNNVILQTMNFI